MTLREKELSKKHHKKNLPLRIDNNVSFCFLPQPQFCLVVHSTLRSQLSYKRHHLQVPYQCYTSLLQKLQDHQNSPPPFLKFPTIQQADHLSKHPEIFSTFSIYQLQWELESLTLATTIRNETREKPYKLGPTHNKYSSIFAAFLHILHWGFCSSLSLYTIIYHLRIVSTCGRPPDSLIHKERRLLEGINRAPTLGSKMTMFQFDTMDKV